MSELYVRSALKVVIAQICQNIGWHCVQNTPLEVLVDLLHRYMHVIAKTSHRYSEQYSRTEPNLDDLGLAFKEIGVSIGELEEYVNNVEPVPFVLDVPKFPVPKANNFAFPKENSREVLHRPEWVHEHLPRMHPDQDDEEYMSSPSHFGDSLANKSMENITTPPENATPVSSPTPGMKRPLEMTNDTNFSTPKIYRLEEDVRPMREVTSVTMTAAGIISPVREGKLPDSKTPMKFPEDIRRTSPIVVSTGSSDMTGPSEVKKEPKSATKSKDKKLKDKNLKKKEGKKNRDKKENKENKKKKNKELKRAKDADGGGGAGTDGKGGSSSKSDAKNDELQINASGTSKTSIKISKMKSVKSPKSSQKIPKGLKSIKIKGSSESPKKLSLKAMKKATGKASDQSKSPKSQKANKPKLVKAKLAKLPKIPKLPKPKIPKIKPEKQVPGGQLASLLAKAAHIASTSSKDKDVEIKSLPPIIHVPPLPPFSHTPGSGGGASSLQTVIGSSSSSPMHHHHHHPSMMMGSPSLLVSSGGGAPGGGSSGGPPLSSPGGSPVSSSSPPHHPHHHHQHHKNPSMLDTPRSPLSDRPDTPSVDSPDSRLVIDDNPMIQELREKEHRMATLDECISAVIERGVQETEVTKKNKSMDDVIDEVVRVGSGSCGAGGGAGGPNNAGGAAGANVTSADTKKIRLQARDVYDFTDDDDEDAGSLPDTPKTPDMVPVTPHVKKTKDKDKDVSIDSTNASGKDRSILDKLTTTPSPDLDNNEELTSSGGGKKAGKSEKGRTKKSKSKEGKSKKGKDRPRTPDLDDVANLFMPDTIPASVSAFSSQYMFPRMGFPCPPIPPMHNLLSQIPPALLPYPPSAGAFPMVGQPPKMPPPFGAMMPNPLFPRPMDSFPIPGSTSSSSSKALRFPDEAEDLSMRKGDLDLDGKTKKKDHKKEKKDKIKQKKKKEKEKDKEKNKDKEKDKEKEKEKPRDKEKTPRDKEKTKKEKSQKTKGGKEKDKEKEKGKRAEKGEKSKKKDKIKEEEESQNGSSGIPKITFKLGGASSNVPEVPKIVIKPIVGDSPIPSPLPEKLSTPPPPGPSPLSLSSTQQSSASSSSKSHPKPQSKVNPIPPAPKKAVVPAVASPESLHSVPARTVITETVGTIIDSHGNKIWICPACTLPDDGSPMIGCDECDEWYHWVCVNIKVPPKDEESWFCSRCILKRQSVQKKKKKHKKEK